MASLLRARPPRISRRAARTTAYTLNALDCARAEWSARRAAGRASTRRVDPELSHTRGGLDVVGVHRQGHDRVDDVLLTLPSVFLPLRKSLRARTILVQHGYITHLFFDTSPSIEPEPLQSIQARVE